MSKSQLIAAVAAAAPVGVDGRTISGSTGGRAVGPLALGPVPFAVAAVHQPLSHGVDDVLLICNYTRVALHRPCGKHRFRNKLTKNNLNMFVHARIKHYRISYCSNVVHVRIIFVLSQELVG